MNNTCQFFWEDLVKQEYLTDPDLGFSVSELGGHGINSKNYMMSFDDKTCHPLHIKVVNGYSPELLDKLKTFDQCFQSGVKTAEIVKTKDACLLLEASDFTIICFHFYDGPPYSHSRQERGSAARELARLNKVLSGIEYSFKRKSSYDLLSCEEIQIIQQKCERGDDFEKCVLANIDLIRNLTEKLPGCYNISGSASRLEHFDYRPANIIFDNNDVAAILDFDSIMTLPNNLSVAFACDRFSNNVDEMIEFLNAYQEVDSSFGFEETRMVPNLIKYEALMRINFILKSHFFKKNLSWNKELVKHLNIIQRINEMKKSLPLP